MQALPTPFDGRINSFTVTLLAHHIEECEDYIKFWYGLGVSVYHAGFALSLAAVVATAVGHQFHLGWPFLLVAFLAFVGFLFMLRAEYWQARGLATEKELLAIRRNQCQLT